GDPGPTGTGARPRTDAGAAQRGPGRRPPGHPARPAGPPPRATALPADAAAAASAPAALRMPDVPPATHPAVPPAQLGSTLEAPACPPNSDDTSVPLVVAAHCIAEHLTSTRRN